MERLLHTVQELSLARELAEVQRIVRTAARELTGCDGATFVLRDNGQCYYADEDAIAPLWKGSRFPMEICISGWAMLNKRPAIIRDIYADARIPHAAYRPTFVKSLVMVPIRQLDPIGAIGNYWAHEYPPTDEDVRLLQGLADATSIAMENVQVYGELEQRVRDRTAELERANAEIQHLSVTDEMTRLYNRRGFYVLAEQMLKEAQRRQLECMLAYIDVDGLKRVNDTYGHDVGDQMIAAMADVLRKTLRQSDIIARMGGDEFCMIALLEDRGDAETLENRLQAELDRHNRESGALYALSASIGMVCIYIDADTRLDALISLADAQMYAQKQSRRLLLSQI